MGRPVMTSSPRLPQPVALGRPTLYCESDRLRASSHSLVPCNVCRAVRPALWRVRIMLRSSPRRYPPAGEHLPQLCNYTCSPLGQSSGTRLPGLPHCDLSGIEPERSGVTGCTCHHQILEPSEVSNLVTTIRQSQAPAWAPRNHPGVGSCGTLCCFRSTIIISHQRTRCNRLSADNSPNLKNHVPQQQEDHLLSL